MSAIGPDIGGDVDTTSATKFDFTYDPTLIEYTVSPSQYIENQSRKLYGYICTGAIVFDNSDNSTPRVLLIQRSASDSMPNLWEVPGGGCDPEDQSVLHAVARELQEEAGLATSSITHFIGEPQIFLSRSKNVIAKFNFVVQARPGADGRLDVKLDPEEHQQFVWATESEVRARKAGDVELKFTARELEDAVLEAFAKQKA